LESGGLAGCLWAPMVGRAAKSDILLRPQMIEPGRRAIRRVASTATPATMLG
jgi:hypothetical protein